MNDPSKVTKLQMQQKADAEKKSNEAKEKKLQLEQKLKQLMFEKEKAAALVKKQ